VVGRDLGGVISFDNEHELIGRTRITLPRLAIGLLLEAGQPQRGQRRPLAKRVRRVGLNSMVVWKKVQVSQADSIWLFAADAHRRRDHSAGDTAPLGRPGGRTGASHLPLEPQHREGRAWGGLPITGGPPTRS
jgi:hypothetical protein